MCNFSCLCFQTTNPSNKKYMISLFICKLFFQQAKDSHESIITKKCKQTQEEVDYVKVKASCCLNVLIIVESLYQIIRIVYDKTREYERPDTGNHLVCHSSHREDHLSINHPNKRKIQS